MITDTDVQRIISQWCVNQGTALYALARTGAISDYTPFEVQALHFACDDEQHADIWELESYVEKNGPRGPVDGWSTIEQEGHTR